MGWICSPFLEIKWEKERKCHADNPLPGAPTVGVLTRGSGSQLVNAACFLVPDDDARGNHSNARFYPGSGRGAVRPAKGVCEGTILSCTRGACSRGYKRGERGSEAPKSLLEVELVEMSAQSSLNVLLEREARETKQTRVQRESV